MVSVIITTFHNEVYLPRAIESVLHQTYQPIELIVVDDNPPESEARKKTEEVMKQYPNVIYIRHPENRNGAAARNTGIAAAHGTYIAFLDNDDIYFHNHIENCVKALEEHPQCSAVLCGVVKICGGLCWDLVPTLTGDLVKNLLFRETALGTGSNLFVKADAVRAIHGFDERFRRHQDIEFGLRLFGTVSACSLPQVEIIKEMDGYSNVPNLKKMVETKQLLWNVFQREISQLTQEEQKYYYAKQYSSLLYQACKSGDVEKINWTKKQLTNYRKMSIKETVLVLLSKVHLFCAYEGIKKLTKYKTSKNIYQSLQSTLLEEDFKILQRALNDAKKE